MCSFSFDRCTWTVRVSTALKFTEASCILQCFLFAMILLFDLKWTNLFLFLFYLINLPRKAGDNTLEHWVPYKVYHPLNPTHTMYIKTNYTNPSPLVIFKRLRRKNIVIIIIIRRRRITIIITIIQQEHLTKLLILRHLQQTSLKLRASSASNTTRNLVK